MSQFVLHQLFEWHDSRSSLVVSQSTVQAEKYSKVELILQAEGVSSAVTLALRSGRLSINASALSWLAIAVISQIGLACLGLCYAVENAKKLALIRNPGMVAVPDMTTLQTTNTVTSNYSINGAQEYTANIFGSVSLMYNQANFSAIPRAGSLWTASDPLTFCDTDAQICAYQFMEQSFRPQNIPADADFQPITVAINRTLQTTLTYQSYKVVDGGNGSVIDISYTTTNGTTQFELPFAGGINQTTFMTYTADNCGLDCGTIQVFESSLADPWFYECNVTVGAVLNASQPEHEVGEELRALAARGTALQGYAISSLTKDTRVQYQIFPSESIFGTALGGDTDALSVITARFAIGVIAVTAQSNDDINIPGYPPTRGLQLIVSHWNYIALILSVAVVLQLILSLFAAWVAYQIMLPADGLPGIARVLRAMTLEDGTWQEHMIIDAPTTLCNSRCVGCRWIYRYRYVKAPGFDDMYMEKKMCNSQLVAEAHEEEETMELTTPREVGSK